MKTSSIIAYIVMELLTACVALGQSTFWLINKGYGSVDAPVFDAQGAPLEGASFLVELWGGATPDSLTPALTAFSHQRVIIPFLSGTSAGYFRDDNIGRDGADSTSVLAVPSLAWAWLQVRAWDAKIGATYEEAAARGLGGYGESPSFYAQGGTPFGLPGPPGPLIGLQSFSLREVVPEPSTLLLLLLGFPFLWMRSRKSK